jgi:osmotically-inducible protein OsmY
MAIRDFFRGDRDRDNDRWREQWRDDRYPQRYSSGSDASRDRDYGVNRGQRGPQFYGQSGRADWADQRDARNQGSRSRDPYEWGGDRNAGGWDQSRDDERNRPYHGGFYAGETGRESIYQTEPSGQGDWGQWASQERSSDQRTFGSGEWTQSNDRQEGIHRGRGPKGYQRSDERIHEEVCERLTDDSFIDASNIDISVQSGVVTLTGTVNSRQEKRRAEDLIENLSGVKDVHNSLRVGDTARSEPTAASSSNPEQTQGRQQASQQTPRH